MHPTLWLYHRRTLTNMGDTHGNSARRLPPDAIRRGGRFENQGINRNFTWRDLVENVGNRLT